MCSNGKNMTKLNSSNLTQIDVMTLTIYLNSILNIIPCLRDEKNAKYKIHSQSRK